jgi:hypothetical protein
MKQIKQPEYPDLWPWGNKFLHRWTN